VAYRLIDERMVGNPAVAWNVFEAGRGIRKHRRHEVVGQHPLDLWRNLAAATRAWNRERDRGRPAPACLEDWRIQKRLDEHVAGRGGMQIAEDVRQRKRMLWTERQHQGVLGRCRLELEVELPAEPLSQREPPGLVDAAAERRMQDQL